VTPFLTESRKCRRAKAYRRLAADAKADVRVQQRASSADILRIDGLRKLLELFILLLLGLIRKEFDFVSFCFPLSLEPAVRGNFCRSFCLWFQ